MTPRAKSIYDVLAEGLPDEKLVFLNYGYHRDGEDYGWVRPEDLPFKYQLALVRHVLEGIPLKNKTVLEIGSGRGGNCSYLARYTRAARIFGLDYNWFHPAFSRRFCRSKRAAFLRGDAQRLPFSTDSVDVVLNLESSHCYRQFGRFLSESYRVLKPGGVFAYADFWNLPIYRYDWRKRARKLRQSGFEVLKQEDITEQVFQSLRKRDGLSKVFRSLRNPPNRELVSRMILGNDAMRASLASGLCRYWLWHFRKPD